MVSGMALTLTSALALADASADAHRRERRVAAIGRVRRTNHNLGYARNKRIQASVYFSWPLAAKCAPS